MSGKNQHWGSTLDDFLHEEGICEAAKEEAAARAIKIEQLKQAIRDGLESGEPTPWNSEEIKKKGRAKRTSRKLV